MQEKLLFESKGHSKIMSFFAIIIGGCIMLMGLRALFVLLERSGWSRYDRGNELTSWITVIFLICVGFIFISCAILFQVSYLRIYEHHIEAMSFNIFSLFSGLSTGNSTSNLILTFDEIKGVSIKGKIGIVLETPGKAKLIPCKKGHIAQQIIYEKIRSSSLRKNS